MKKRWVRGVIGVWEAINDGAGCASAIPLSLTIRMIFLGVDSRIRYTVCNDYMFLAKEI